ncbi:MAG: phage tail protein [Saprospiraceae bacterium]
MEGTLATIYMFGGNFAPNSWAFCDGQLIAIAQNTALFALIGTIYGGNGQTTFALPDLRSRVPMGEGQGPGLSDFVIGEQPGAETATLTTNNLPAHSHTPTITVAASTSNASSDQANGNIPSSVVGPDLYGAPGASNGTLAAGVLTVQNTGSNTPINLVQPVTVVTFVICTQGVFPSRN